MCRKRNVESVSRLVHEYEGRVAGQCEAHEHFFALTHRQIGEFVAHAGVYFECLEVAVQVVVREVGVERGIYCNIVTERYFGQSEFFRHNENRGGGGGEAPAGVYAVHQVRDSETLLDNVLIIDSERVLLNASTAEIGRRLAFVHTSDAEVAARALYAQPSVGGISAVLPNDGSFDTEINLECLFELASTRPDELAEIFNKQ